MRKHVERTRSAWILAAFILAGTGARARDMTTETLAATEVGPNCMTSECHADMGKKEFLHGPMNFGQCRPCHVPIDNKHSFAKRIAVSKLCLICHELETSKRILHKPFAEDCTQCHIPHESDTRYFVKGGTGSEGCLSRCHEDFPRDLAFMHFPAKEGGCLACHGPHQSDNDHLLVDPVEELCVTCHTNYPALKRTALSVHEPVKTNQCTACHTPHGGPVRNLLPMEPNEFCRQKCHQEVFEPMEPFPYPHSSMVEQEACSHCHESHTSQNGRLLSAPVAELCYGCHNMPIEVGERTLSNIKSQIENAPFPHGPIERQNCVACHKAHGSEYPSILIKSFPSRFYAVIGDKTYEVCFDCHNSELLQNKRGTHSNFRNGDRNLHYVHTHIEKSRTCRACHHEHASPQPKMIRSETPYGKWDMSLKYLKSDTGGGCVSGCHQDFRYDRVEAVDNTGATSGTLTDEGVPGGLRVVKHPEKRMERAPAFSLVNAQGKRHDLDADSGPTLLLFADPAQPFTERTLTAITEIFLGNMALAAEVRRWIIVPAKSPRSEIEKLEGPAAGVWRILQDKDRRVVRDFGVTAMPMVVLIDKGLRIQTMHAGYDMGMGLFMHKELEKLLGRKLFEERPDPPAPGVTRLHMARRLAARGLYESALKYYERERAERGLTPSEKIEFGEILVQAGRTEEAVELLKDMQDDPELGGRARLVLQRAHDIQAGPPEIVKPPAVTR